MHQYRHPMAERRVAKSAGGRIEKRAAGKRERAHEPVAERIMDHRRAAARRMVSDLLLRLEHGDARMFRKRGCCRETGDPAADDEDIRTVHVRSGSAEPLVHDPTAS